MEDKCKHMRPSGRQVWDKWETNVKSAQGTQSGRQVGKTSIGNKCKLMRPKAFRVEDKCGRQVGDKCKLMRPKAHRVGDKTSVENKCRRQV